MHTPDDAPLLECLDVACDNGAAQTLCSGEEMSVGLQTGAIALTLTSEFAVPPPPPPIVYGAITAIAQLGADIDGEAAGDESGYFVRLSADGTALVIGAPFNDGNGNAAGHARVYDLIDGGWLAMDPTLMLRRQVTCPVTRLPSMRTERSSPSAHRATAGLLDMGGLRWTGTEWQQMGGDLDGRAAGYYAGWSSIGSQRRWNHRRPRRQSKLRNQWRVRSRLRVVRSEWAPMGSDIEGEAPNDCSGFVSVFGRERPRHRRTVQ